jgi:hypothetical protein
MGLAPVELKLWELCIAVDESEKLGKSSQYHIRGSVKQKAMVLIGLQFVLCITTRSGASGILRFVGGCRVGHGRCKYKRPFCLKLFEPTLKKSHDYNVVSSGFFTKSHDTSLLSTSSLNGLNSVPSRMLLTLSGHHHHTLPMMGMTFFFLIYYLPMIIYRLVSTGIQMPQWQY